MKATTYQRANHKANRPKVASFRHNLEHRGSVSAELLYYWAWQVSLAILLLVTVEFLQRVNGPFHAYTREQFHVVRWCIGTNLFAAWLISTYARRQLWSCGLLKTLIADALISLLPVVPAILAHLSGSTEWLIDAFNLAIGTFLLLKCAALTFYVCHNATSRPSIRQSTYIFAATFLTLATFARWYNMSEVPQADESHYTLLTYSLIHDHDFDLTNNYAERDYAEQFPGLIVLCRRDRWGAAAIILPCAA